MPRLLPSIGGDKPVCQEQVYLSLHFEGFGQLLPVDKDVKGKHLLVFQADVAALLCTDYAVEREAHAGGVGVGNEQGTGRHQSRRRQAQYKRIRDPGAQLFPQGGVDAGGAFGNGQVVNAPDEDREQSPVL